MEAQGPARHTTCLDHHLVGGALVGRRGRLQAQRGKLRLEQLGKLGMPDSFPKIRAEELALTESLARYIHSPPPRAHR